ncbi:eyes absent homolog 3 isoform X1 [Polypterus senegalus]|uniref:eyes absent homolog 3 isoform X1 n=1 Tax=Polypterus senegalus TaxID=55291 RepID=UPI001966A198|nr:eyes absent homolog 3 isoform X1 [Polypterus senegalus]XP_039595178.1 eyes absent homolog 3 isoform X1 [Polypterus senegalus]
MDDPQELTELPAKKARHELHGTREHELSRTDGKLNGNSQVSGGEPTLLKPDSASFSIANIALSGAVKAEDTASGNDSATSVVSDPAGTYTQAVTSAGFSTKTTNEYTSQLYQVSKPYTHIISPSIPAPVTTYAGQQPYTTISPTTTYSAYHQTNQNYGLPPFGVMWPGIKSESGITPAPCVGQPGFVNFSTAFTSVQAGQAHYSYPSQGSNFTTSSVYSSIPGNPVVTVSSGAQQQEYPTYTSIGQNQYTQYYAGSGYGSVGVVNSNVSSATVDTTPFECDKTKVLHQADSSVGSPPSTNVRDAEDLGRRNSTGKTKGKAKKGDNSKSADNDLERVFLWDLDETIIVFHSLLTGNYAEKFGKDQAATLTLGLQMEELIFELADNHLFFNDLEECDQVHIEDVASDDNGQDLSNYNFSADSFSGSGSGSCNSSTGGVQGGVEWMRKLAFRYRRLKEIYNAYKSNAGELLSPGKRDLLIRLQAEVESITDSWLGIALKSLHLIQSRGKCINVLVTTTQLVPALAKVLLYGLGEVFPIENIYSATKIGKESCFERIMSRFGKKVTYVVIGDGRDEEFAAKQHNMPFWRISNHGDLISLHQALELDFL